MSDDENQSGILPTPAQNEPARPGPSETTSIHLVDQPTPTTDYDDAIFTVRKSEDPAEHQHRIELDEK